MIAQEGALLVQCHSETSQNGKEELQVSRSKKFFLLSMFIASHQKSLFVGGISGTPQLGIVLEDYHDSLDEGSGMKLHLKKVFNS